MQYASLASGSKGNCHAFSDGERILLVDAGISFLQIKKRLEALNWPLENVQAFAITHEHWDHINAVPVILNRTNWSIMATPETLRAIESVKGIEIPNSRWIPLDAGWTTNWEGWDIHPFKVPHDAIDPVAYRLEVNGTKMAIVTDLGYPTALVVDYCKDLELLVLESNHDIEMLRVGPYDPRLKSRILSRVGHLSNEACADLIQMVISPALKHVVLAHLSEQNNDPSLARLASTEVINRLGSSALLHISNQTEPLELIVSP